jgi:hypothetical protein
MAIEVSIGHLTGTAKVVRNTLCGAVTEPRDGYTIGQMFFKPYESKEEFLYCANHTIIPGAILSLSVIAPFLGIILPCFFLGAAGMFYIFAGTTALFDSSASTIYWSLAEGTLQIFAQLLVDVLLLPITAVAMLTRGIATGIDAVVNRLADHDESKADFSAPI